MTAPSDRQPDLLEQIPDPDTVRSWLAESIRRSDLLRFLLRLAKRKAVLERTPGEQGSAKSAAVGRGVCNAE
jgi:hypothetical protein